MGEKFHIPIAKHLEDQDDLIQGRDASLVPGQEILARNIAEEICNHAEENDFRILYFAVSPKKRAIETSEMVKDNILSKVDHPKIIYKTDHNLREIDQGDFILPNNYKPGDHYPGLKMAGKIFSSETFNSDGPAKDNLDYHFGDALPKAGGGYKFPELAEYFSRPGESYKEVLLRFYSCVVSLSESMERFAEKTLPVIFTHGQPHQIFKNLAEIAERVKNDNFTFKPGELPRICWDLYQERRQGVVPFGKIDFVSIEHITNPKMIGMLKKEIDWLNANGK